MQQQHHTTERVAVVTGGSEGVGRAVIEHLVTLGYTVWAVARRTELLEDLAAAQPKGTVIPAPTDLTHVSDVDRLVERIRAETPEISALVHSAGSYSFGPIEQEPTELMRRHWEVNVESAYRLTQDLLDQMSGAGDVVFLNSSQGLRATAMVSQFAATMHARKAIADALRDEVNQRGIRVTSIHLGRTATPLQEGIYASHGWRYDPHLLLQPSEVATMVGSVIGLPRTAEVTDMSMRPAIKSY
jgi:NADP-dependent 3-hydroxy acid dehydrogenase YdfG